MKKAWIIIFIAITMIAINTCSDPRKNGDNGEDLFPPYVSIIQLIAHPAEYHGRKIMVKGFVDLRFEGTAIFFCKDDLEYGATKNAIWLRMNYEMVDNEKWYYINGNLISNDDVKKYHGKYVFIVGTFDMYETGHLDFYSGGDI